VADSGLHVWLKVDCGYHRAGVDPSSRYALDVARELGAERGLTFDGILSHSGHAYRTRNKDEAAQVAEQERQVMAWFAELLRKDGLPVRGVSVGSTPAMAAAKDLTGVTEARPGNYIFYDRTMVLIGCCDPRDVACHTNRAQHTSSSMPARCRFRRTWDRRIWASRRRSARCRIIRS
jgi:D-serine deaminase-like pyridoxal phosphate-dependent protein